MVRITATNICGSDLHMYQGRTDLEAGKVIGHENLGEVIEVGSGVTTVTVGDRVCLPFNIGCGFCQNCSQGLTGFCLTVNPGMAGGAYGYADMGPNDGGQAELLRVPYVDFNALQLPEDSADKENDYVLLADIFPTGWHGTRLAGIVPGDTVAVYGAGPVGTMAAYSAVIQGASQVFVIDHIAERLALADRFGAVDVDSTKGDPVEQVKEATDSQGVDRGVQTVGYQAHDSEGHERSNLKMNALVEVVVPTGGIGVVGVFVLEDLKRVTSWPKLCRWRSTSGRSSSRVSLSVPVRRTSSRTTDTGLTSFTRTRPARRCWCSTTLVSATPPTPTPTSTPATTAGPRSFSTPPKADPQPSD